MSTTSLSSADEFGSSCDGMNVLLSEGSECGDEENSFIPPHTSFESFQHLQIVLASFFSSFGLKVCRSITTHFTLKHIHSEKANKQYA
jgi:hypothetical protein